MSAREIRRHIGRLVVVGFSGQAVPDDLRRLVSEFDLAGVVYFERNVAEPGQVAELSREIADLARAWPLWIGIGQGDGRFAPLGPPFTPWPSMRALGRAPDATLARRFAEASAAELRAVGVTLNFGPVLNILSDSRHDASSVHALGEQPEQVARLGGAIVRAWQTNGLAACATPFPGLGESAGGTGGELPLVEHPPDRLDAIELVPFRAAIEEDVALIMAAHVLVPALDETRPASLSPAAIDVLLKRKLGYQGVVVSDDLGAAAIAAARTAGDALVQCLSAGADIGLLCHSTVDEQAISLEAAIRAAESGTLSVKRIDDAMKRQRLCKERFAALAASRTLPAVSLDGIGCAAHEAIVEEMAAFL